MAPAACCNFKPLCVILLFFLILAPYFCSRIKHPLFLWILMIVLLFFYTFASFQPLFSDLLMLGSWLQEEPPKELTNTSRSWQASWKVISMDSEVNSTVSQFEVFVPRSPWEQSPTTLWEGWAQFSRTHLVHNPHTGRPLPVQARPGL